MWSVPSTAMVGSEHLRVQGGSACDNSDGSISPAATEVWYDGIDSDCSGGSDYDQDSDGQDSEDYSRNRL